MSWSVPFGEQLGSEFAEKARMLLDGSLSYAVIHAGLTELRIGSLLDYIKRSNGLLPPRTGHVGNWDDIALGRAGAIDFNQAICFGGHGYPLIYGFTQTEAEQGVGDWVYLPGSVANDGQRHPLPLRTWDGNRFVKRTREHPLFVPFVLTEVDRQSVPLVDFHWKRMRSLSGFEMEFEASLILREKDRYQEMLKALLEDASRSGNPRRSFQDLISHGVSLDGRVSRAEIRQKENFYVLNEVCLGSVDEFIRASLIPFRAVVDPDSFFSQVSSLPPVLPILSHLAVSVLTAIFESHYPRGRKSSADEPINLHFHWGARDMAGYPPVRSGYFVERSTTRSMKAICASLSHRFRDVRPVCIFLLPASVFMLCPSNAFPEDAKSLARIIERILNRPGRFQQKDGKMRMEEIRHLTHVWLEESSQNLSQYFLSRFFPRQGVAHELKEVPEGMSVEPEGFRELSFQEACMLVGSFMEARGAR